LCAARSATGGLASTVFSGSAWSKFDNQSATSTSAPGCGSDEAGRVICAMRDKTGKIIVNRYNGTGWDGFINIGGLASGEPVCGEFGVSGEAVCFARGTDVGLWGTRFAGGAWSPAQWTGWGSLGGPVASKGACSLLSTGQLICGAIFLTDSALYVNDYNGSSWLGFVKVGQTAIGTPSCVNLNIGSVLCAVVGVNSKTFSTVGP